MDERGRNRTSKWDLIDDQRSLEDNGRENARAGNYRASPNDYRSYSSRHSSAHAAEDDPKYPADAKDVRSKYEPSLSVRDHASGNRGTWRNNSMDRDNRGFFEASTNWDDDGSRRDHDHSPRSSWKRPLRSTSRGRSRSRSRSPVRAYRHESGVNDRNRSKPEVPIQTCIDFTSGRCRRGSHCPFLHTSTRKQEDRKYDFEHREESIRGGKYSHHNAADAYYNDCARETLESKREYDTNSRWTSSNQGAEREPQRSASIPCTFFAAGTCRNGKFCRFSHQIPASNSSGETARDMRWRTDHGLEKGGQKDLGTKFNDTVDPRATEYGKEGKWRTNGSPNRVDQINPHVFEHGKESHGKVISPLHNSKVVSSSVNGGWGNNIETSYVAHSGRTPIDKVVEVEASQSSQWKSDNPGNINSVSELKGVDNWIGDKMSPEWNPKVPSARTVAKEDPAYAIQTSGSGSHDIPPETVQLMHYVSSAMPDEAEINDASGAFSYDRNLVGIDLTKIKSSFLSDNPAQLSTQTVPIGAPGILNAVGQGQFLLAPNHPGTENASANTNSSIKYDMYSKSIGEDRKASEATSCATPASKIVRQEQLAQLTDLSASLAHLLGKGHELPHFYASINPPNPVSSVEVSNGLVSQFPVETVPPYPPIGSKKPYEPVLDEAMQMQANTSVTLAQYPSNPGMNRTSEDVKQETPSAEQNGGEAYKSSYTESNLDHKQGTDSKPNKKPQTIHEGSAKRKDKHAKSQEGNPLENVDDEGKVDRGKKVKDTKALRDFKHALVNFVKELLKPAWKDGQIDKESFKTIVKKTVDKVTSTIQEASIPQTPEKVDQYLSASKPKLTKLVQAYVDRNLKKQTSIISSGVEY